MVKNVWGFTFYALDLKQIPLQLIQKFGKAEAILFSDNDLRTENWNQAWENMSKVANIIGNENLSFHFPMDNCDYINNELIKEKLIDSIKRANQIGIKKIIIHPNLRYKISEWNYINREKMKVILFDFIKKINMNNNVLLCLENMPPIGNQFDDADSAILFASDINEKINYTWDICHYFNVVRTMSEAYNNKEWNPFLAKIEQCDYFDFKEKLSNIKHFHFSAFENIANPLKKQICKEGILPSQSCVSESYYKKALQIIYKDAIENNKSIIFEIAEENYCKREKIIKMLDWAENVTNLGG